MQGSPFYPTKPLRPAVLLDQARLARVLSRSPGYSMNAASYSISDAKTLALAYERFAAQAGLGVTARLDVETMMKAMVATYPGYVADFRATDVEMAAGDGDGVRLREDAAAVIGAYLAEPDGLSLAEMKQQSGWYEAGETPPPHPYREAPWS